MNKKKPPSRKESSHLKTQSNDNSITAQRVRVLSAPREAGSKGKTVIQLREKYDCMMPSARVHELRHKERLNIQTIWTAGVNAQGNEHKTGRYILFPGYWNGNTLCVSHPLFGEPC